MSRYFTLARYGGNKLLSRSFSQPHVGSCAGAARLMVGAPIPARPLSSSSSESSKGTSPLMPGLSPEQIRKIGETDHALRSRHELIEGNLSDKERDEVRRKRIIYRSKQRGWLEVDLLLGSWAKENVPKLTPSELDDYELILKEETIDIFNYVSGKDPVPPHLKDLRVMKDLQNYALKRTMASPEDYANIKKQANLI